MARKYYPELWYTLMRACVGESIPLTVRRQISRVVAESGWAYMIAEGVAEPVGLPHTGLWNGIASYEGRKMRLTDVGANLLVAEMRELQASLNPGGRSMKDVNPEEVMVLFDKMKEQTGVGEECIDVEDIKRGPERLVYLRYVPPKVQGAFRMCLHYAEVRMRYGAFEVGNLPAWQRRNIESKIVHLFPREPVDEILKVIDVKNQRRHYRPADTIEIEHVTGIYTPMNAM